MEWQAMLFHFTCKAVQGQAPIIAVHRGSEPLLPNLARDAALSRSALFEELSGGWYRTTSDVCGMDWSLLAPG